eukprot:7440752-Lingulodinium_polyedra.AAC.1
MQNGTARAIRMARPTARLGATSAHLTSVQSMARRGEVRNKPKPGWDKTRRGVARRRVARENTMRRGA